MGHKQSKPLYFTDKSTWSKVVEELGFFLLLFFYQPNYKWTESKPMQKQHKPKNMPWRRTYKSFNLSSFTCISCLMGVSPFLLLCFLYKLSLPHQKMKNCSLIINVTWNIHLLISHNTFSSNCHTISKQLPRIPTISVQTRPQHQAFKCSISKNYWM